MAQAEVRFIEKQVTRTITETKRVQDGVTLVLTQEEAELIKALLGKTCGVGPAWATWCALNDAGISTGAFTIRNTRTNDDVCLEFKRSE